MRAMVREVLANWRAFAARLVSAGRHALSLSGDQADATVIGCCDGVDAGSLYGWAWRPSAPDDHVEVEQWVDGVLQASTVADLAREDLEGVVSGAHAWRMPLMFDRAKRGLQQVEIRVSGGEVLTSGVFHFISPDGLTQPEEKPKPEDVVGHCDGVDGLHVHGWAWRPSAPDEYVEVEQWVDGVLQASTVADLAREDLEGVVSGAHAWRMPLMFDRAKRGLQQIEIRVSGGEVLTSGVFHFISPDALTPPEEPAPEPEPEPEDVVGHCDGIEGLYVHGWAWRPRYPEEHVEVEQWVDGVLAAKTVANLKRTDLEAEGVGSGRYGWRMPLVLDSSKSDQQLIELKINSVPLVTNGTFSLEYAQLAPMLNNPNRDAAAADFEGHYDGVKGAALHGWARSVSRPDDAVEVELWVDGEHSCSVVANEFRPDLRSRGVGHGRYGFRLPITIDPAREEPIQIEIRIKGAGPVSDGVFTLTNDLSPDDPKNAALTPFVDSILNPAPKPRLYFASPAAPATTFILYCPEQRSGGQFWSPEYDDYAGVADAFVPILTDLGAVVRSATLEGVERACAEAREAGRNCLLISFTTPRLAPLTVSCPVVPAFAWSFPTIPSGKWDGDARSDWRFLLRQTGRAIVFSSFAADAVRAAMGPEYPVAVVPVPVTDRRPQAEHTDLGVRQIAVRGVVLDSRDWEFDPGRIETPAPLWSGNEGKRTLNVEGVVLTAALDLNDGRSNWQDLVSAFVIANSDKDDATLVMVLSERTADWWLRLYKWLRRMPQFKCRVIALRGELDDNDVRALIRASNWSVTAANAEGLCMLRQALMSAGRPAIGALHTAALDYLDETNALIVASEDEAWTWPDEKEEEGFSWTQHPDDVGLTTRQRISWTSLSANLAAAYGISRSDPARYAALSVAAAASLKEWSGDAATAARLDTFLGLNQHRGATAPMPSRLLTECGS